MWRGYEEAGLERQHGGVDRIRVKVRATEMYVPSAKALGSSQGSTSTLLDVMDMTCSQVKR